MTSASSTINKRAGFMPLFAFSAKQFWTTILLFTIILFFVLPVPVLMMVTDYTGSLISPNDQALVRALNRWSGSIRFAIVPLLSAFSVVVSCARFAYLKNKVSIDFYHSIPVKRSRLYLTQLGVGALSLIIPFAVNLLFTLIIIAANGCITATIMANILTLCAEAAIYVSFFYALSTLVGMISGLTAVQLTLTAVAMFLLPVVYAVSVAFVSIFNENIWSDWYFREEKLSAMTPVFRFLLNSEPLAVWEAILMLLAAIAMFVGAFAVYRLRKSERAGTPVVFKPLGEVIKYVLVYIGTLLGGLLFYLLMDSFFWTVFGLFCGTVLVFMLTNTILNKTAKSMFKGWKGLCAYGIVAVIGLTMLMSNAFGINSRLPSPAMTSRVCVNFSDTIDDMEFRDKENIEALYNIYTNGEWGYRDYPSPIWSYESFHIQIVFYPKVGLPVAKSVRICNKSELIDDFRTILDSEEFKEQYTSRIDLISSHNGSMYYGLPKYYFDEKSGTILQSYGTSDFFPLHYTELTSVMGLEYGFDAIKMDNVNCSFDFFQNPTLSVISTYFDDINYKNFHYPLLTSMSNTLRRLQDNGKLSYSYEELIDNLAEYADSITIYKVDRHSTEEYAKEGAYVTEIATESYEISEGKNHRTITNKNQMREILRASSNPFGNYYCSDFTFVDTEYYAVINYECTHYNEIDLKDVEYSEEILAEIRNEQSGTENRELAFLAGKVPAFVIDMLG